jgi:aldose 1-epimerase
MSLNGSPLESVVVASSAIELTVLPRLGARLHRLRAFGVDVLRTPDDPREHERDPFYWGGHVMAPWGNRLEARPVTVGARTVDLASNFQDGSAIHGQVYLRPWEQRGDGEFAVRAGGDGWPWPYEAVLRVTLDEAAPAVRLEQALTNLADDPMPAGLGIHPWFRRPIELLIDARRVYPDNLAGPAAAQAVEGELDLRQLRSVPADLDATWIDLADPPVQLRWPEWDIACRMSAQTDATLHVVAASPSEVDAIAVEPATNAPQALRRLLEGQPGGLVWLPPGETLRLDTLLSFERLKKDGG